MKLSEAQRRGLEWFLEQPEPVGAFRVGVAPSPIIRKRLEKAGLIEEAGREPGTFGFIKYAITPAGIKALEDSNETE